jgi:Holliday junction resolvase
MINSRSKGAQAEREWRDVLRDEGYLKARRGQQFSGSPDSPDVVCPELAGIHFEVKRVEKLNIADAMAQAAADCAGKSDGCGSKTPVVAHRRNRTPWLVTMLAADFFKLLRGDLTVNELNKFLGEHKLLGAIDGQLVKMPIGLSDGLDGCY